MPRQLTDDEARNLHIACMHEGAHAAACVTFRIPMDYAYVDLGNGGGVILAEADEDLIRHDDYVLMTLGGPETQARVEHSLYGGDLTQIRRRVWEQNSATQGDDSDIPYAASLLERTSMRSMRQAERKTADLVTDLWPSIQSIAAGLHEHGRLSAGQIRRAA